MKSIALICLIGLIEAISCATAPVSVPFASICSKGDPEISGYVFEKLDEYSSIEVTNEGAINCSLIAKVNSRYSNNYEVTMYIDTFTYLCRQFKSLYDQATCLNIRIYKELFKPELVLGQAGSDYDSFEFHLPRVSNANGSLKAYVTLVSKQYEGDGCRGSPSADTLFKCADNTCIYGDFKCNGVFNCQDQSDEADALCKAGGRDWVSWLLIGVAVAVALAIGCTIVYVKAAEKR
ncbi:hypothetical protein HDE_08844 [Halotydeus destructor]|nr:hypothetical protein HDE_08844 [Halotydeus destructor]